MGELPWTRSPGLAREPAEDSPPGTDSDPLGAEDGAGYEDWYLLDDYAALGVLNVAAVAHGHRTAHDEVARRFGAGAGGLYGLLEGHASLDEAQLAIWVARPPGAERGELGELLGDGMDPARSSLWRRQLVLGPAPEYCLLAPEPPAGVAPTRLGEGWSATICGREVLVR
ncbi:MAG TPA: hypothetical protein VGX16_00925 [Solirubrobacteraceae bacterium]|nr:hypothetical protein [Solirubrobacteraceae bacterium]